MPAVVHCRSAGVPAGALQPSSSLSLSCPFPKECLMHVQSCPSKATKQQPAKHLHVTIRSTTQRVLQRRAMREREKRQKVQQRAGRQCSMLHDRRDCRGREKRRETGRKAEGSREVEEEERREERRVGRGRRGEKEDEWKEAKVRREATGMEVFTHHMLGGRHQLTNE